MAILDVSRKSVLCLLLCLAAASARGQEPAKPWVIAHRGASGYLPEHTLAAKALAYGMGADYIEQDVVLSKDGVPIVLHDITLDDVTDVENVFPNRARDDGRFYALDFTLAELRRLRVLERAGRGGQQSYPGRFPRGKSRFSIATLREELELILGLNHSTGRNVGVYPEIKAPSWHRQQGADVSRAVLKLLREFDLDRADAKIFVQCFEAEELKRWRGELQAKVKLVQLLGGRVDASKLAEYATYAQGVGPSLAALFRRQGDRWGSTGLVADAHRAGLQVHPYTVRADRLPAGVDRLETLLALLRDEGVDGYFTDFPDRRRR